MMDPVGAVAGASTFAAEHGAVGFAAFASAHALAILACFPATLAIEFAAGAAFGLVQGVAAVWLAKTSAAAAAFALARGPGRAALRRAGVDRAAADAVAADPRLAALARVGAEGRGGGFRLTLAARLSPIPSWANNWGLALAFREIRFRAFLPATAVASLPAIVQHVAVGASLASLAAPGPEAAGAPPGAAILGGLSAVGFALLVQQVAAALSSASRAPD